MSRDKQPEKKVPGTEWAYKYKFKNDLPDLPFDPKLLEYPFPVDRVYRYQHDELITSATLAISGRDNELGVPVAPFKSGWLQKALQTQVAKDAEAAAKEAAKNGKEAPKETPKETPKDETAFTPKELDEADRFLMEDEAPPPPSTKKEKRKIDYNNLPSWMVKTGVEYQEIGKKAAKKVKYVQEEEEEEDPTSHEAQVRAIEKSFEHARDIDLINIRHPKKANLRAVEIVPVFPNFDVWTEPYALVNYDGDIVDEKFNAGNEIKQRADLNRSNAVLKSMESAAKDPYVALYFPTEETIARKRKGGPDDLFGEEDSDEEDQVDEYTWVRDYQWQQMPESGRVVFEVREGKGAYYRPFEGEYQLTRQRRRIVDDTGKPARIKIGKREETYDEKKNRREVERMLEGIDEQDADGDGELEDTNMEAV